MQPVRTPPASVVNDPTSSVVSIAGSWLTSGGRHTGTVTPHQPHESPVARWMNDPEIPFSYRSFYMPPNAQVLDRQSKVNTGESKKGDKRKMSDEGRERNKREKGNKPNGNNNTK